MTGLHHKHAVRAPAHVAISSEARPGGSEGRPVAPRSGMRLWRCGRDRICSERLKVMIPTLLPSLEQHARIEFDQADRALVLGGSAATIDRLPVETKIAAAGGKRRRVVLYIRRCGVRCQSGCSMTGTIRRRVHILDDGPNLLNGRKTGEQHRSLSPLDQSFRRDCRIAQDSLPTEELSRRSAR